MELPDGYYLANGNNEVPRSFDIHIAIRVFYRNGYITEEEAKDLEKNGWANRNACTSIVLSYFDDEFFLICYENDTPLFHLSYNKISGILRQLY